MFEKNTLRNRKTREQATIFDNIDWDNLVFTCIRLYDIPFPDTYFPPSRPPPVSMLAPRIQTSDFCWPNIELGERGALFLSNYMKLHQLSHSFWQRL